MILPTIMLLSPRWRTRGNESDANHDLPVCLAALAGTPDFLPADYVLGRLRPCRSKAATFGTKRKLTPRFLNVTHLLAARHNLTFRSLKLLRPASALRFCTVATQLVMRAVAPPRIIDREAAALQLPSKKYGGRQVKMGLRDMYLSQISGLNAASSARSVPFRRYLAHICILQSLYDSPIGLDGPKSAISAVEPPFTLFPQR